MMRIKVCGMRQPENIEALLELPIDYIGFILYYKSKRYVGNTALAEWLEQNEALFEKVKKVGVVVNGSIHELLNVVHDYKLDFLQLHGDESAEYCREISLLWQASSVRRAKLIKAFSVDEDFDFSQTAAYEPYCSFFIFDTKGAGYGGTGRQFDWDLLNQYDGTLPFILSGGIGPDSLEDLQGFYHPRMAGIDLNSRFEIEPGLKNIPQLETFISKLNTL